MAYRDFKDLPKRTASDKSLCDKTVNIAKNKKYGGYQRGINKFFDKKSSSGGIRNKNMSNQELAEELHKPMIKKFEKRKVHSSFINNIWGAGLADMQLISKFNKGFLFLLCIIDIYNKCAGGYSFKR